MTNADRIRSMTDDELYEFLSMWEIGDIDYSVTFCDLCKKGGNTLNLDCDGCRKHWIESSADAYNGINSFPDFKAGEQKEKELDIELIALLLSKCLELFKRQDESPYALNLLEEIVDYDGVNCDGYRMMEDIENVLEDMRGE